MEQNRFKPSEHLWLGACTLLFSWPMAACCSFFAAASESHKIVELFMLCCAVPGAAGMVLSTLSLQKKLFERLAPAAKHVLFDQVQCKDMNEQAQKELRKLQQIQVMMKMMAMLRHLRVCCVLDVPPLVIWQWRGRRGHKNAQLHVLPLHSYAGEAH